MGGLCYAQGGAGYGLNNVAMRTLANSEPCSAQSPDTFPEDTFTGLRIYNEHQGQTVLHCGGFRSSELVSEPLLRQSISFHYIDAKWLAVHGHKLIHWYNKPHDEHVV